MVDQERCLVGHHVAGHPSRDLDHLELLDVLAAVEHRPSAPIAGHGGQQRGKAVDGVPAGVGAGGMGPAPREGDADPHGALAAGLDDATGGLTQDGGVGDQQVGSLVPEVCEPVELLAHLLAGVEAPRHVHRGLGDGPGQVEEDGHAALHVGRTDAVEDVAFDAWLLVAPGRGDGVEMAGEEDPLLAPQIGAGHDVVTHPLDRSATGRGGAPLRRRRPSGPRHG